MENKSGLEIRYKHGSGRQVFCTKIEGPTFLLGKWGNKTKPLFLCTGFEKKSICIFLKATYAMNISFEKNKTDNYLVENPELHCFVMMEHCFPMIVDCFL